MILSCRWLENLPRDELRAPDHPPGCVGCDPPAVLLPNIPGPGSFALDSADHFSESAVLKQDPAACLALSGLPFENAPPSSRPEACLVR